jgi:endogenous inhibitor of DNA gyrase (YacG/DUF329 family)
MTSHARRRSLTCKRCGEKKEQTAFSLDRSRAGTTRFPWCKACVGEYNKGRRSRRWTGEPGDKECPVCDEPLGGTHSNRVYCSNSCKEKARRYRVFGLEPHEYRQLRDSQEGRCPICGKNVKLWALDHDHATGETMGVTCSICNHELLAYSYHDPEIVRRLLSFLLYPPVRTMFGERRYVGPEQLSQKHRMWAWSQENAA